jgi:uncharacterized membrane protein YphA (DoxX/SURF4 family)
LTAIVRILFGLFFLVMGLNFYYNFMQMPPMPMQASLFMMSLAATGYVLQVNAIVQIVAGLMLILNLWAALALVLLAPLIMHIGLFHLYLDSSGLWIAAIIVIVELFLAVRYRSQYAPLFRRK